MPLSIILGKGKEVIGFKSRPHSEIMVGLLHL